MSDEPSVQLKIFLPPNLERVAVRDAIPVKIELVRGFGVSVRPEAADDALFSALEDRERGALFAIASWCGGSPASFLQLTRPQLRQLTALGKGADCFYWVNKPLHAIPWHADSLVAVSEHLAEEDASSHQAPSEPEDPPLVPPPPSRRTAPPDSMDPPSVDGSEHYLAVMLPDRGHPVYASLRALLESSGFRLETSNRRWWLRDRHKTLNFLGQYWTRLETRYDCVFTENFKRNAARFKRSDIECRAVEDEDGFQIHLEVSAGAESTASLQSALTSGRQYVERDDSIFLVDPERINQVSALQQALSGDRGQLFMPSSRHRIPSARLAQVEKLIETLNPNFTPPETWKQRSAPLRNLSRLDPAPLPDHAAGLLRPYQVVGTAWLHHLHRHHLGGILADDMGLGKTIQALAFLASIRSGGGRRRTRSVACVICPASLLENWRRETARFFPELTTFVHHGARRLTTPEQAGQYDLIITSYGTLVRDRDLFASISWISVIADEAQHAKNRRSQNAQALFGLKARSRFVLTGTPVENSLDDLRTLVEFILPGAAPTPATKTRGEDRRWFDAQLAGFAGPYILRRIKTEVAKELPAKIEQTVFCELAPAQRDLYERFSQEGQRELEAMENKGGSEGAMRNHVFKLLLRLRQICCDPRLVATERAATDSAKLAAFRELLDEAMDAGHRILLFSQFVSLLDLVRATLDDAEIPYLSLDGRTRNRQELVDRFNQDDSIPIFLISLRAGGTGLNLTGADTVIHFDPWWNPAVEAQATDRAHRIGQTRVVTSYRLITSNTVEEKVLELQQSKRRLLEQVFDASDLSNARLGLDDLRSLLTPP